MILKQKIFVVLLEIDYFGGYRPTHNSNVMVGELVQSHDYQLKDVRSCHRIRRNTHWRSDYKHVYEAIRYASEFLHEMAQISLGMNGSSEMHFKTYTKTGFEMVDQLYRKFIYHLKRLITTYVASRDITDLIENKI